MNRLDFVFGTDSIGTTAAERAATSKAAFVRSQVQLAIDSPRATGRKLAAAEALKTFGLDVLEEVVERGGVSLVRDFQEPARTLRKRRQYLGLTFDALATAAGVSADAVRTLEQPAAISSAHVLERVAQHLALDERVLGAVPKAWADVDLGQRLRALNSERVRDDAFILTLTDASWVIRRQDDLRDLLGRDRGALDAFPAGGSDDYDFPAYQRGFALAARTRQILGHDPLAPIDSLTKLAEDAIGVALVETDLGPRRIGAMITNGKARGIALSGAARTQPFVRRTTLAHELCHLLWDRRGSLESVRVERATRSGGALDDQDPVETRANAFAIALLAPPAAVEAIWARTNDQMVAERMIADRFGITTLAAARHLANCCRLPFDSGRARAEPPGEVRQRWAAAERRDERFRAWVRPSRAGRFADLVLEAATRGLVSRDSACTWLLVDGPVLDEMLAIAHRPG